MQTKDQLTAKIIERIGGDSLGHILVSVLNKLGTDWNIEYFEDQIWIIQYHGDGMDKMEDISLTLLKDNKEAKLQDQSPECIEKLAGILGVE